jgi:hypothetical protein
MQKAYDLWHAPPQDAPRAWTRLGRALPGGPRGHPDPMRGEIGWKDATLPLQEHNLIALSQS